jgi:hypothetical protein
MSKERKAIKLFDYNDDIESSEEEMNPMGFDDFLGNRGNDKNNKRKNSSAPKKEEKSNKKQRHSYSEEEEEDLVVMPTTTKNKIKLPDYEYLFDDEKSRPSTPKQITDIKMQETLEKTKKLKATIAQTQQSINYKATSFEFDDEEDNSATNNVVKINVSYTYGDKKNRQFTFAVKKLEKFELLAEILGGILSIPAPHIQFRLYNEVINLKKCPNDYSLMDGEKLIMNVTIPTAKPQLAIQKSINLQEDENEDEVDDGDDDEYKKELDKLISDARSGIVSKPEKVSDGKISLHVSIPGQNKHQKFKILPTDTFSKVIAAILKETGKKIKLQFEGEIIDPNMCPEDFDMEGGEQIDGKF